MRTSFIKLPSIKIILSFGILFSFLQTTFAQYWEAGVNLGTTSYLGDLQSTLLQSNTMGMHFGVWTRWNMNRYLSFEAQVNKGDIQASDSNLPAFDPNHARNLNFRSTLVEVATTAQLNLLPFDVRDHKISTPYIFAGVGAVYHNPQAELNGVYYNLKELGTEGQHLANSSKSTLYTNVAMTIPYGIGMKFSLSDRVNVGVEAGFRLALTDYIDDVSSVYPDIDLLKQSSILAANLSYRSPEFYKKSLSNPVGLKRGNDAKYDQYFFAGIKFSMNLASKYKMEFDPHYKEFYKDFDTLETEN